MGSPVSKDDVDAAAARPACVFDSVAQFNAGSNIEGAMIRSTGVLLDCPSHEHAAKVQTPTEGDVKLAAFMPTGASSNACPGDHVECTIVRVKNHSYFAQLTVTSRGKVGLDIDRHGAPVNFTISFTRYLECCGIHAQQEQQAGWFMDSSVFQTYFKGRQVHWSGVVREVRHKERTCVQLDANILQSRGAVSDEPVRLDFDAAVSVQARSLEPGCRIRFDAVIASQGGPCFSWHTLSVTRLFREAPEPVVEPVGGAETGSSSDVDAASLSCLSITELKAIVRNHGGNPDTFLEKPELVIAAREALMQIESGGRNEASTSASHDSVDGTNSTASRSSKRQRTESSGIHSPSPAVDDDGNQCVICQDSNKTHAFVPCGHRCVCEPCGQRIIGLRSMKVCPLCRQAVTCTMRIFT